MGCLSFLGVNTERIKEYFEGAVGHIYLLDKQNNCLILTSGNKLRDTNWGRVSVNKFDLENNPIDEIALKKEPVIVSNIHTNNRYTKKRDVTSVFDFQTIWSVPIADTYDNILGIFHISERLKPLALRSTG